MSLNDPKWGKRGGNSGGGGGGPPDLDEIWRNVNRRLADMLGRRGDPELPQGEQRPPRAGLPL